MSMTNMDTDTDKVPDMGTGIHLGTDRNIYMDMDTDMDMDMDTYVDKDMNTDMDTVMDADLDMGINMVTDAGMDMNIRGLCDCYCRVVTCVVALQISRNCAKLKAL
jgi:hypothetical protein